MDIYRGVLTQHLLPALGPVKVVKLHRGVIKAFLAAQLTRYKPNSVKLMHSTLQTLLAAALDDGLLTANPAGRLGRQLKLQPRRAAQQETIQAMTRAQCADFFLAVPRDPVTRPYGPLFLTARTGMRLGEGLAVRWPNVDLAGREIRITRTSPAGGWGRPRAGMGARWT